MYANFALLHIAVPQYPILMYIPSKYIVHRGYDKCSDRCIFYKPTPVRSLHIVHPKFIIYLGLLAVYDKWEKKSVSERAYSRSILLSLDINQFLSI
jgi:hypothetical protein